MTRAEKFAFLNHTCLKVGTSGKVGMTRAEKLALLTSDEDNNNHFKVQNFFSSIKSNFKFNMGK